MPVFLERGQQLLDRLLGLSSLRPQLHQRGVDDDAVEPGRQLAVSFELVECPEGAQIRGLDDVLRVLLVADEPAGDGQEASAECPDEVLECPFIAGPQPSDEDGLVHAGGIR